MGFTHIHTQWQYEYQNEQWLQSMKVVQVQYFDNVKFLNENTI